MRRWRAAWLGAMLEVKRLAGGAGFFTAAVLLTCHHDLDLVVRAFV